MFGITKRTPATAPTQKSAPATGTPPLPEKKSPSAGLTRDEFVKVMSQPAQQPSTPPQPAKVQLGMGDSAFWNSPATYRHMASSAWWANPNTYMGHGR